eukprot:3517455-Rhodomonas_salina.2
MPKASARSCEIRRQRVFYFEGGDSGTDPPYRLVMGCQCYGVRPARCHRGMSPEARAAHCRGLTRAARCPRTQF